MEGGTMIKNLLKNIGIYSVLLISAVGSFTAANYNLKSHNTYIEMNNEGQEVTSSILFMSSDINNIKYKNDYYSITNVNELFSNNTDNGNEIYCQAEVAYNDSLDLSDVILKMKQSGDFDTVEEDAELYSDVIPTDGKDPYMQDQWYLEQIHAYDAWGTLNNDPGKDVVVAVIDTGVNYSHGDLKKNMWVNDKEANGIPGYDDDGNGVADDVYGANFTNENSRFPSENRIALSGEGNPKDTDPSGHGTHVAGIIAMTANNGGGCGIAYGSKIMAVKAGNAKGEFSVSSVIAGLNYAVEMGANVINMSFGTYTESAVFKEALKNASKKCVLVAAAGNDGLPTNDSKEETGKTVYPAAYPFVIGVMATDQDNKLTSWSNYDYQPYNDQEYEIAAPGYKILSTVLDSKYAYMNGTSMASPMVAAAAAVVYGSMDNNQIKDPVNYVYTQLTQATNSSATCINSTGREISYPELNLYDSLTVEPKVSMSLGYHKYYDASSCQTFDNNINIKDGEEANIYCGFRLNNLWSDAKDVNVYFSVLDKSSTASDSNLHIDSMNSNSNLDVQCNNFESMSFKFKNEPGTYNISLLFNVYAKKNDNSGESYFKQFKDTITINVLSEDKQQAAEVTNTKTDNTGALTENKSSVKSVSLSGEYKNIIVSWEPVANAAGYYVYRSVAASKKYTKIASVLADNCIYKDKKTSYGKKYFYKIMPYYSDGSTGIFSSSVNYIMPNKFKKINCVYNVIEGKNIVTLKWAKVKGANKYVIYGSNKKNSGYKNLAVTTRRSFIHKLSENKTYYFKIRSLYSTSTAKVYGNYSKAIKIKS